MKGKYCESHKIGYISNCPSCMFEKQQEEQRQKRTKRKKVLKNDSAAR